MTKEKRREKWIREHPDWAEQFIPIRPKKENPEKEVSCIKCGVIVKTRAFNRKYCGSALKKTGCSYEVQKEATRLGMKRWIKKLGHRQLKTKEKIKLNLGLKCKHCGLENSSLGFFDLDHITPIRRRNLEYKHSDVSAEFLKKDVSIYFQVFCPNCHRLKTISEKHLFSLGRRRTD